MNCRDSCRLVQKTRRRNMQLRGQRITGLGACFQLGIPPIARLGLFCVGLFRVSLEALPDSSRLDDDRAHRPDRGPSLATLTPNVATAGMTHARLGSCPRSTMVRHCAEPKEGNSGGTVVACAGRGLVLRVGPVRVSMQQLPTLSECAKMGVLSGLREQ